MVSLQLRHNDRNGVANNQPHDHLLNRLFKAPIKENIKAPHHWPREGNSPVPAQRASNTENVSIWWRHHDIHLDIDTRFMVIFRLTEFAFRFCFVAFHNQKLARFWNSNERALKQHIYIYNTFTGPVNTTQM